MESKHYDPGMIEKPFFKIYLTHLPTQSEVSFRGWVTRFDDNYTSEWNETQVYGRMDPLTTFQGTGRKISIDFDVPSGDYEQAIHNLLNINRLIEFLYPVYNDGPRSMQNTLKASPLIGMRWTNLIANPADGQKLVGYLAGCSYAPNMAEGGFIIGGSGGGENPHVAQEPGETRRIDFSKKSYAPKVLSISLNYTVIHTHLVGWYNKHAPLPEGTSGPVQAPQYLFGSEEIDGKFPNAFLRGTSISTVSDASGSATSTQVTEDFKTEILK